MEKYSHKYFDSNREGVRDAQATASTTMRLSEHVHLWTQAYPCMHSMDHIRSFHQPRIGLWHTDRSTGVHLSGMRDWATLFLERSKWRQPANNCWLHSR